MQIKIEIDVKPDELRRFLGLPDVTGLQDDVINFLRDKVGAASEFDAGGFVKTNLDRLLKGAETIVAKVRVGEEETGEAEPKPRGRRRKRPATTPEES